MIKMPGLAGLTLVAVGLLFLMISRAWRSRHNAKAAQAIRAELLLEEEAWKELVRCLHRSISSIYMCYTIVLYIM